MKYLSFWVFFVEKWAKSSSESHIAPESPSILFPEFGSPKCVQLGTSVDFWGTRRNFSHFWPYLAKYQIWHFWQKSYPHNFLQNWVRTSIFCWRPCLFIIFNILDPNFEVCLHTSPTNLPSRNPKNECNFAKNRHIELRFGMKVDFDPHEHLLMFKCVCHKILAKKNCQNFSEKLAKFIKIWKMDIFLLSINQIVLL